MMEAEGWRRREGSHLAGANPALDQALLLAAVLLPWVTPCFCSVLPHLSISTEASHAPSAEDFQSRSMLALSLAAWCSEVGWAAIKMFCISSNSRSPVRDFFLFFFFFESYNQVYKYQDLMSLYLSQRGTYSLNCLNINTPSV